MSLYSLMTSPTPGTSIKQHVIILLFLGYPSYPNLEKNVCLIIITFIHYPNDAFGLFQWVVVPQYHVRRFAMKDSSNLVVVALCGQGYMHEYIIVLRVVNKSPKVKYSHRLHF